MTVSTRRGLSFPARAGARVALLVLGIVMVTGFIITIGASSHAPTIANDVHLFDHTSPDGTAIVVSGGDVTFFGTCNCWATRPGVLINYTLPDGTTGATPSLATDTRVGDVQIVQSWVIGPSFVAAQLADRVTRLRMQLKDGRWDELTPAGGWAVFATTVGFTKLEAYDAGGNMITSCVPVQGASGC